jgi:flavin reductase (DIM6/NTAB) family NADH-FMN oxidoreductase RutF
MPFAINILDVSQAHIAARCGGAVKGEARFQVGSWYGTQKGVPLLADAQACLVCEVDRKIEYGTHGIFIGKVLDVVLSGQPDPLVYVDGRFTRVKLESPDG